MPLYGDLPVSKRLHDILEDREALNALCDEQRATILEAVLELKALEAARAKNNSPQKA